MDAKTADVGKSDARTLLVGFYNRLPQAEEFSDVDKGDFFELTNRFRNQRQRHPDEAAEEDFPSRFHSMGPPPRKAPPLVPEDGSEVED